MEKRIMATDKEPNEHSPAYAEQAARQTMDVAHGTLATYFRWLRKMQSASPWGDTPLNKALLKYTEQNVDSAFTFAQKLSQAKNAEDVAKIQTEFMQTQFNAFSEQVKNLGAAYIPNPHKAMKRRRPRKLMNKDAWNTIDRGEQALAFL
jgi:hypothetical protein